VELRPAGKKAEQQEAHADGDSGCRQIERHFDELAFLARLPQVLPDDRAAADVDRFYPRKLSHGDEDEEEPDGYRAAVDSGQAKLYARTDDGADQARKNSAWSLRSENSTEPSMKQTPHASMK
jgi:hypothetical protein